MENVEGFRLLPYQFEPECAGGEPVSAEEASETSDSDTELGEEGEHEVLRVENHDWCSVNCVVLYANAQRKPLLPGIGCLGRQEMQRHG